MKRPGSGLRRRDLAAGLATPLLLRGQTAVEELPAARKQTERTIEQLRKFRVDTVLEPSFSFRP